MAAQLLQLLLLDRAAARAGDASAGKATDMRAGADAAALRAPYNKQRRRRHRRARVADVSAR
jgi:hypothetical protein